jgi:hypothetical protein
MIPRLLVLVLFVSHSPLLSAFTFNPFAPVRIDGEELASTPVPEDDKQVVAEIKAHGWLTDAIHETLTVRTLETLSAATATTCPKASRPAAETLKSIVLGSRWNDDPHGYLTARNHYPGTFLNWYSSMKHAGRLARRGSLSTDFDLLYRSHYHDLQFLHAMAKDSDETAAETRDKAMMWIEYAYRVSTGEIGPKEPLAKSIERLNSAGSKDYFKNTLLAKARAHRWTPAFLFDSQCVRTPRASVVPGSRTTLTCTNDDPTRASDIAAQTIRVRGVALGSILHVLQDSYSASHTVRIRPDAGLPVLTSSLLDAGDIIEFGVYGIQRSRKHAKADVWPTDMSALAGATPRLFEASASVIACSLVDAANAPNSSGNWVAVSNTLINGALKVVNPEAKPTSRLYATDSK